MLHNNPSEKRQNDQAELLENLKKLPDSVNSIDKEFRREQVKKIQLKLDEGLFEELNEESLNNINSEVVPKNYRLIKDAKGKFVLRDRDNAHEVTYSDRFKYYLENSDDKNKCKEALTQFTDELCRLEFFSNLIDNGVRLLDIGAGDGSVAVPVAKALNRSGKAEYIGVERDSKFVPKIEEKFKAEGISSTIYAQDFRKILEPLSKKPASIALASHLYTTTPMKEFLPMVFDVLGENGVIILVHDTVKADAVKFRSSFGNLLRLGGKDSTIEIDKVFNQVGLDSITTSYTSSLKFPEFSEHDWQALKQIKQADYDNKYLSFSKELQTAKNLIDFVISDKLEAFTDEERNNILDQIKDFLTKNNNQFQSTCKIQVALSPKHTLNFKKQFLHLKDKIENPDIKLEESPAKDVATSLEILQQSKEPEIAAKQPISIQSKQEEVVAISMFTDKDKSPRDAKLQTQSTLKFGNP